MKMTGKTSVITPEGVLGVLFKKYKKLSFYYSDFHTAFYKVCMEGKYDDVLKDFRFSGSPLNPFSEELNFALSNLQIAALSRLNPGLVEYSITSEFDRTYEIVTEGVDDKIIKRTEEMCGEIKAKLPLA